MIKPGVYAIEGEFGGGKTTMMTRRMVKMAKFQNVLIFTNVKLNDHYDNVKFFTDLIPTEELNKKGHIIYKYGLLDILDYCYLLKEEQEKRKIPRNKRLKIFIFYDEASIIFDKYEWANLPAEFNQHIRQVRKYNIHLFFCTQNYKGLSIQFRNHANWCFYFQPFLNIPSFGDFFGSIRKMRVDEEGNPMMYKYIARDERGDQVVKEKPIDYHVDWIWKPSWWIYYDDLFLNFLFNDVKVLGEYKGISDYSNWWFDKVNGLTKAKLYTEIKPMELLASVDEQIEETQEKEALTPFTTKKIG